MYIGIILAIAAFASDVYTAIVLLAFDRWSSSIEPYVPFRISRWLFAGCIILSVLLFIHDYVVAFTTMRTKNISLNYTDPIARNIYSIRGYRYFCLFAKITKSRSKTEYLALFVYFSFKGWIRLIFADSPRQVLNGLTLYSVLQISGDFVSTVKKLAQNSIIEAVVIGFMAFSLLVWVFNIIQFGLAIICAIPLYVHIGHEASGLEEYCCVKVNQRIAKLVEKYHKKGMIELAEANKKLYKQPSLPRVDTSNLEDHFNEKAKSHYSVDQLSELYPHRNESIVRNGRIGLKNGDNKGILRGEVSMTSLNSMASNGEKRVDDMAPLIEQTRPKVGTGYRGTDQSYSDFVATQQIYPITQVPQVPQAPQAPNIVPDQRNPYQAAPQVPQVPHEPNYPPRTPPTYQYNPFNPYSNENSQINSQTSLRSDPWRNVPFPDPNYGVRKAPYPDDNQEGVMALPRTQQQLQAQSRSQSSSQSPSPPPVPPKQPYSTQVRPPPLPNSNINPYAPALRTVQQPVVIVDEKPKPLSKQHSLPIYNQAAQNHLPTRQHTLPGRLPESTQTHSIMSHTGLIENADSRKSKLSPTDLTFREPKLPSFDAHSDDPFEDDDDDDLIVYPGTHKSPTLPFEDQDEHEPSSPLRLREPTLPSFNEGDLSIHTPKPEESNNPFSSHSGQPWRANTSTPPLQTEPTLPKIYINDQSPNLHSPGRPGKYD